MKLNVAIMGATGAVGQEMLRTLEMRHFPCTSLKLLASERSVGKKFPFRGRLVPVEKLTPESFEEIDIVLASAGASVSREFVPYAVKAGAVVVDNTSAFRMEPDIPLVVPEVNADALANHKGIIANPNCSTAQMVVAIAPIHRAVGIKRLVISTYQSVSGTGQKAIDECLRQTREILLEGKKEVERKVYPHQIAFNVLPHIDVFLENGYTKEEMKMVNETRKILGDQSIAITATTVRVPVIRGHSESVNIETHKKITASEVRELLAKAPGVVVVDDPKNCDYPTPIYAEGRDETYVGRIREDISNPNGIEMWIVSDNLRKGAALNAVQIAEELIARKLIRAAQ
ncbi:MAG: aspartate-semialdehyde dehydrogenase [Candidatus Hydrogenedentota bacterium]|uniref:Aspartate-semialdehyde dehydrogenase n=1 Tax=Sumerlaea chitinivorans TaxID=2250252 RepID=A0A2Z4Y675_SUMC1|nr:Aspartate-semialdehyde dehydrogenase [Candidatus Sumerlaea chitinivorans]MCX7964368.1 aspartate-semialdehyde dehydrogenase [Candidatus Sumerlaea chitinivorans]RMH24489.1 MAG: aspartate-semialdehyde dehydrogenase [Candidatus Hydrogenedentota bacterium]GIX45078.1 MAG: aspartate-semialdehyde dehydrogenase [Candidatus Sumerlaea sp.]